jgi:hypothetical protein
VLNEKSFSVIVSFSHQTFLWSSKTFHRSRRVLNEKSFSIIVSSANQTFL